MATVDESVAGLSQTVVRLWSGRRDDSVFPNSAEVGHDPKKLQTF